MACEIAGMCRLVDLKNKVAQAWRVMFCKNSF